jgi:hypothetical protein
MNSIYIFIVAIIVVVSIGGFFAYRKINENKVEIDRLSKLYFGLETRLAEPPHLSLEPLFNQKINTDGLCQIGPSGFNTPSGRHTPRRLLEFDEYEHEDVIHPPQHDPQEDKGDIRDAFHPQNEGEMHHEENGSFHPPQKGGQPDDHKERETHGPARPSE